VGRPRIVILVEGGIVRYVASDQPLDIDVLVVDVDDDAIDETVYTEHRIAHSPVYVETIYKELKDSHDE
jgi:DNA repair protein RadC